MSQSMTKKPLFDRPPQRVVTADKYFKTPPIPCRSCWTIFGQYHSLQGCLRQQQQRKQQKLDIEQARKRENTATSNKTGLIDLVQGIQRLLKPKQPLVTPLPAEPRIEDIQLPQTGSATGELSIKKPELITTIPGLRFAPYKPTPSAPIRKTTAKKRTNIAPISADTAQAYRRYKKGQFKWSSLSSN